MKFINQILEIKPFEIIVLFNNNEKRKINFAPMLENFPSLKDEKIFSTVTLDDYPTLKWDGLATIEDYDGIRKPAPLDFCPDTLFEMSVPV